MTFKVLCDVHIAFKVVRFFEGKGHEAIMLMTSLMDSTQKIRKSAVMQMKTDLR